MAKDLAEIDAKIVALRDELDNSAQKFVQSLTKLHELVEVILNMIYVKNVILIVYSFTRIPLKIRLRSNRLQTKCMKTSKVLIHF